MELFISSREWSSFIPETPRDLHLDGIVRFSRLSGKTSEGVVKFAGHLPGQRGVYIGVELHGEGIVNNTLLLLLQNKIISKCSRLSRMCHI